MFSYHSSDILRRFPPSNFCFVFFCFEVLDVSIIIVSVVVKFPRRIFNEFFGSASINSNYAHYFRNGTVICTFTLCLDSQFLLPLRDDVPLQAILTLSV